MNIIFYLKKQLESGRARGILMACLFISAMPAFAADVNVTGKITDSADGSALPGVSVFVKGTQAGTTTDVDGKFSLSVKEDAVLVFSFIGYTTQEVAVGGRTVIDVVMISDTKTLQEVVVTALGIERAEQSLGFSYSKVKGGDLTNVVQENALNSLAARVPGVAISSMGTAGSSVLVNIRGVRSLTGDNQPLFVIDGVPVANTSNNISQIGSDK